MQYSLLFVAVAATFTTLISAQGFAGVPACAQNCVLSDLPASCNLDLTCICGNSSFITNISCCVSTACDTAGQNSALAAAQSICAGASVSVSLPTAAGCSNGAVAAASSTGSASGTSTASSHSSTVTGSSASSAASSASKASSSSVGVISSAASSAASSVSMASSAAASATSRADAGRMAVQGMGLAGAVLGAVVLL